LSALADGTAPGATSSTPAPSNAAPVRLKRRDQARREFLRLLRLMLTRRFYGFLGPRSHLRLCGDSAVDRGRGAGRPVPILTGDGMAPGDEARDQRPSVFAPTSRVCVAWHRPPCRQ